MKIEIELYGGEKTGSVIHVLHVAPEDTVSDLLSKWQSLYAVRVQTRTLNFGCKWLPDHTTIASCGIVEGSRVYARKPMGYRRRKRVHQELKIECSICLEEYTRRKLVYLEPCGHAGLCKTCARALKECPECREPIKSVKRAKNPPRIKPK